MRFLRRNQGSAVEAIPLILTGKNGEVWIEYPAEVVAAVRMAVNRIMRTDPFPEKLVFTSAVRQEGVSYLSKAAGVVLANDFGRNCCVVELNWWWPADNPKALMERPGVAEILSEKTTLEEALIQTGLDNLFLLTAGKMAPHKRTTFAGGEALGALINSLETQFDHLIFDLPAINATSDAILLAGYGTGLCFVIHQGVTPVQRVQNAMHDLDHLNIIGIIMNQVDFATPRFVLDYISQE